MTEQLQKFNKELIEEVHVSVMENSDSGTSKIQAFTRIATDKLIDAGETENVVIAYDERRLGLAGQHMINGYAISENYETLDLFITIFDEDSEDGKIQKTEITRALNRLKNFLLIAINKHYVDDIDPATQIFELAYMLDKSRSLKENLVRVNAIFLTNGIYTGDYRKKEEITQSEGWTEGELNVYFRVVDLSYLFNISERPYIPIEIDFRKMNIEIPCLKAARSETYESYLAIMPGVALAKIYEQYGQRLLEQNIRTFLQFKGRKSTNSGIRNTINKEPGMFFAYNNGITATAEDVVLCKSSGQLQIDFVRDLQIVNGGQTTASIYHSWKKDRAELTDISVAMKLNIIGNTEIYPKVVENIAKYANTQNKITFSDLSANNPFYVELEKLSRAIPAPHVAGQTMQTHWFFERSRAQYKNQRLKEGNTSARLRTFDAKNPRSQMFTKEELAKFINTFSLIERKKEGATVYLVGPNSVVQGSQKNHDAFIRYNVTDNLPDSIWFENAIAKAILFRTAEKEYGRGPSALGDLRYITVPYTLGYLNNYLKNSGKEFNYYKIWQNQELTEEIRILIKELLPQIEKVIKDKSTGSLYGQFAKDSKCWISVKNSGIAPDISYIEDDLVETGMQENRRKKSTEEIDATIQVILQSNVTSVSRTTWNEILTWNLTSEKLNPANVSIIKNYLDGISTDLVKLNEVMDTIAKYEPDLIHGNDVKLSLQERAFKMIEWIKANRHSTPTDQYTFIKNIRDNKLPDSIENHRNIRLLEQWLNGYGYRDEITLDL